MSGSFAKFIKVTIITLLLLTLYILIELYLYSKNPYQVLCYIGFLFFFFKILFYWLKDLGKVVSEALIDLTEKIKTTGKIVYDNLLEACEDYIRFRDKIMNLIEQD